MIYLFLLLFIGNGNRVSGIKLVWSIIYPSLMIFLIHSIGYLVFIIDQGNLVHKSRATLGSEEPVDFYS